MPRRPSLRTALALLLLAAAFPVSAQTIKYPDPSLTYVYPSGGRQGQTVTVEMGGLNGLTGANGVVVDGAPGVTVREVKSVSSGLVRATLSIAADAAPGKRLVRV